MAEQEHDRAGQAPEPDDAGPGKRAPVARDGAGTDPVPPPVSEPGTPLTQQLGRVVLIVTGVLFGVFAVFNFQYVDFNWVFGKSEVVQSGGQRVSGGVPLIILLVVAFSLGALIAWIATLRAERRKRRPPR